jgi:hypothetical protein
LANGDLNGWVGQIEDRLLVPTDYSPAKGFLQAS